MDQSILHPDGRLEGPCVCEHDFMHAVMAFNNEHSGPDAVVTHAMDAKLVAQDAVSPEGMYTLLPRGAVMASLLEEHVRRFHASEEAFPIKPPALARLTPAVKTHAGLSGEGIFPVTTNDGASILRHGMLFSQFSLCAGETLRADQLPLRMYELSPCFRNENGEKMAAFRRTRAFTMVDMHALCRDLPQAMGECVRVHHLVHTHAKQFGWDLRTVYTVDEAFMKGNRVWVCALAAAEGHPVLIRKANPKKRRPINIEYHVVGPQGAVEVAAAQIDCNNPGQYGLRLAPEEGGGTLVAIHLSVIGSLERTMYALTLNALNNPKEGLPAWLAPEQARILAGNEQELVQAETAARVLRASGVRLTIDDRAMSEEEKRNRAAVAMVPIVARPGEERLVDEVINLMGCTSDKPQYAPSFPARLSRWPTPFCV